jgi:hypothetical protein
MNPDAELAYFQAKLTQGSKEKIVTLIQRKSWAKIYAHLTPQMQDAAREIEIVFIYITGGSGYPITDLNHVKGHKNLDPSERMMQMIERYKEWRGYPPSITNKVINMFVGGKTLSDLEQFYGLSKKTCMKHVKLGLNEYCKIAGWGDQLEKETR